ncbi:MAG: uncharacterized protein KVP18_002442 [Porospora cf. gigantea A]|uniref:uncharacterized protein n=1 Tax=Porospora cf. gigantea A TaxID=2853593 RepID=UPI00355A3310|nr:MAG: hypothetical protein KVP18_002442 [Porospora cf. gigantea A]
MNRVASDGLDVKSQLQAQIKRNATLEVSIVVLHHQDMLLVTEQRSKHYLAKLDAMCFTLMKLEKAPQLPEMPETSWRNFLPFGSASPIKGATSQSADDLAEVRNENRALLDVIAAQNLKIESLELREHSLSTDLRRPQDEEREKREAELRAKVEALEAQVSVSQAESAQLRRDLQEVKTLAETETNRRGLVQAECAAKAELVGQTVSAVVSRVRRQLNFISAAKNYRWKSFMRFHCIYHIVHYMGVSNQTLSPQKCSLLRWWLDVSCFLSPEDLQAMPQGSEATTVWKQLLTFEDIVDVIPQAVRSFLQELDHHSLTVSVNLQKLQMLPHVDGPGAALTALTVVHSTSANTDTVEAFLAPLFQSFIDDLEANFETDQARYWADCISVLDSLVTSATLYGRSEASTEFWMQAFVDKLRSVHDLHKQKLVSVEASHEHVREELSLAVSEATKQLRLCEERLKRSKEKAAGLERQICALRDEKDTLAADLTVMDTKTSTLQQQFIKLVGELGQTNLALSEVVSLLCSECKSTIAVKAEHASLRERFQFVRD